MKKYLILLIFLLQTLCAEDVEHLNAILKSANSEGQKLFNYPLNISLIPGSAKDGDILVVLHGYGGNHTLGKILKTYRDISDHIISLDFPDTRVLELQIPPEKTTFGTINELLPVIYLLKKLIVDGGIQKIDLYGFSAGGGALVNILAVLNSTKYNNDLRAIGIEQEEKDQILRTLSRGWILLDAPLKSLDELSWNNEPIHKILNERYRTNEMNPIDTLKKLKGLKLNVILYFETPDEVLTNREDNRYISLLKQTNSEGRNIILKGHFGGHVGYHLPLWKAYLQAKKDNGF